MVNTFLPYPSFVKSAKVLDDKRLYKQIVECKQILKAIEANKKGEKYGYQNHPIVRMWQDYPIALRQYQLEMLDEWLSRRWGARLGAECFEHHYLNPHWLGDEGVHESHRLNLLFKDGEHYGQYFTEEVPSVKPEYKWVIE